mmetsp:Transcript_35273/g.70321  ORF Transcript_35273/g.70321 Transcript_35273/m.70321 type:complete len:114 (+) Transcript_35273:5017-5358(+)
MADADAFEISKRALFRAEELKAKAQAAMKRCKARLVRCAQWSACSRRTPQPSIWLIGRQFEVLRQGIQRAAHDMVDGHHQAHRRRALRKTQQPREEGAARRSCAAGVGRRSGC